VKVYKVGRDPKKVQEAVSWLMSGGYKDFDLIVIDNLTEYEQSRLRQLAETSRQKGVVELQHYGLVGGEITQMVRDLRSLPIHKIFVCWETNKEFSQPDGSQWTLCFPSLTGKTADTVCGICNTVARLEIGKNERGFRLSSNETIYAKDIKGRDFALITELI
jgi:phage nucleotide-binding protein